MDYKYRVYHDYGAAKINIVGLMNPFNADQEMFEYTHFNETLVHIYSEPFIEASCEKSRNGAGIVVTLRTELPEHEAEASLSRLLIKQNNNIPGLCLVGLKLES